MSASGGSIGIHLHISEPHSLTSVNAIKEIGHVQLFTHGPASLKPIKIDAGLVRSLSKFNITLSVHGSYLSVPWRSPFLFKHTLDNFRAAHKLKAESVVIHIPFRPINEWMPSIVKLARQIKKENLSPLIMLEQSATIAHPENSYESPPKLNRLWRAIKQAGIDSQLGICIDTAHTHASGVNIRTYQHAKKYLDMLDPDCLKLIHLNGNSIRPGLKKTSDKHEIPLHITDLIWGGLSYEESGCRAFIEYANLHEINLVIEWNSKRHSVKMLREFINQVTTFS